MSLLKIENLKTYFYTGQGIVKAVDGISFSLKKGEVLGIVGESGSGKSITSLSILRLIQSPPGKIVAGKILFNGTNLLELSNKEMQQIRGMKISMIFQEPMTALNPVFTIGDQITEAICLHLKHSKKEAENLAIELLKSVGIPSPEERIKDYPHQLSGGMRQRVMIAMAISCNPELMIADEPTTALDVTIQAQILELINDLRSKRNMAIIMITHNLGILSELGGMVIVMYAGKIMETADAKTLFSKPNHPYTQGLMKAVPKLEDNSENKQELYEIKGVQPSLIDLPPGCSFAPRCQHVLDICRQEDPIMFQISENHHSACWLNKKDF